MMLPPACSNPAAELPAPTPIAEAVEAHVQAQAAKALESIEISTSIDEHFGSLSDPRKGGMVEHRLIDIITIAVCAVVCGANNWVEVELFGRGRQAWLSQFLELPHGVPSHDTFGRVFARLSGEAFQHCFARWMQAVFERIAISRN